MTLSHVVYLYTYTSGRRSQPKVSAQYVYVLYVSRNLDVAYTKHV